MIAKREHFRLLYRRDPDDAKVNGEAAKLIAKKAAGHFGKDSVHYYTYTEKDRTIDFPVWSTDRRIASSLAHSDVLSNLPILAVEYVFVAQEKIEEAKAWLEKKRKTIIIPKKEEKP